MRKVLLLLVMLLALPFASVRAVDSASGLLAMAQYAPADATLFFAMRTDDGYVDELQAVVDRALDKVPAEFGIPPLSLRGMLMQAFTGAPVKYEDVRAAIGDTISFSGDSTMFMPQLAGSGSNGGNAVVAVEVGDRAKLEELLAIAPGLKAAGTDGDWSMYEAPNAVIAVSDTVLLAATNAALLEGIDSGETLADNEAFVETVGALPADSYNIAAYVDTASLMTNMAGGEAAFAAMNMTSDNIGTMAIGLTILDERALVIDVAQIATVPSLYSSIEYAPVDPAFLANIPAGADLVIHANDLGGYVEAIMAVVEMTASMNSSGNQAQSPTAQINAMFGMTGLSLQDDIIDGATGDFALFGGIDMEAIMNLVNSGKFESLPANFGIAIEMKDADTAANVAAKFGTFVTAMGGSAQGVTIGDATVNGVDVTNISAEIDPTSGLRAEVMLGAKDAIFFLATSDVAQHITGGGDDITSDAAYADAAAYILPDSYAVFYASDEGLMIGLAVPTLALLGPAIGNIYDNVIDGLQTSAAPATRQNIQFQPNEGTQQFLVAIQTITNILGSGSISNARDGDTTVSRLVLTLE
jgi:hypothetical protein